MNASRWRGRARDSVQAGERQESVVSDLTASVSLGWPVATAVVAIVVGGVGAVLIFRRQEL